MNESLVSDDISDVARSHLDVWQELHGRVVLITGATGFIGTLLVKLLLELSARHGVDVRVVALVRDSEKAVGRLGDLYDRSRISFVVQDIREPVSLPEEVDYVIHAASNANPVAYQSDPIGTMAINVTGTANLLNSLVDKRVRRFLYISSVEAYGSHGQTGPISEETVGTIDPRVIRNCYPLSKSAAENLTFSFSERTGVSATVARLAYVYGPGDDINDPKVVTSFLKAIREGESIKLRSNGSQKRSYCYIRDALQGILLVLLKGENDQIYNVSSMSNQTSIRRIADLVSEIFGAEHQIVEQIAPSESEARRFSLDQNNILDNQKLRDIGYIETVDLHTGLLRTGRYFGMRERNSDAG